MQPAKHDGIFKSAQEAMVFACNFSDQQYALSPMAKILQRGPYGSGRGLSGLDGAAQSGMVLAEMEKLDNAHILMLVARCAPKRERCSCTHACCSGWKMNPAYRDAISQLADVVLKEVSAEITNRRFRVAVISKFFGEKITIKEAAADADLSLRTAERHAAAINRYLKDGEKAALTAFYARLDEVGMLMEVV